MTLPYATRSQVGRRLVFLVVLSAGCGHGTSPGFESWGFSVTPTAVEAVAGDSVVVQTAVSGRAPAGPILAEWRSERPAVARIDTVAPLGRPVVLRAVAPGAALVTVRALTRDGSTFALPVSVRARP
jgi:hypothetical protein